MKAFGKVLIGIAAAGAGTALAVAGAQMFARRAQRPASAAGTSVAGSMSVGAVDEVELGGGIARPMRGDLEPDLYDPEEVPSEHPEINELRNKMPFG